MPILEIVEPVGDLFELNHTEHLLIWTLRKIVTGRGGCPMIVHEFATQCREDAVELLGTFGAFLGAVGHASRRRLQIGFPGCLDLTGDERQLLALIAAAQGGDQALLQSHLRWLVRSEYRATVTLSVQTFAALLARHNMALSQAWNTPALPPTGRAGVLHAVA